MKTSSGHSASCAVVESTCAGYTLTVARVYVQCIGYIQYTVCAVGLKCDKHLCITDMQNIHTQNHMEPIEAWVCNAILQPKRDNNIGL